MRSISRDELKWDSFCVTVVGGRAPYITLTGMQAYVGSLEDMPEIFFGGGQVEAMTIDSSGNVYVAAYGSSTDFPVRGGTYSRTGSPYIFKVTPAGSVQRMSAAIDSAVMTIRALAVDASGGTPGEAGSVQCYQPDGRRVVHVVRGAVEPVPVGEPVSQRA